MCRKKNPKFQISINSSKRDKIFEKYYHVVIENDKKNCKGRRVGVRLFSSNKKRKSIHSAVCCIFIILFK